MTDLIVIGGGLAGSEAAWQAAQRGLNVRLYEMRPSLQTGAHQTHDLAELVCSNSLDSNLPDLASGVLKSEMRTLGSMLLECAEKASLPAGGALAVDRELFARLVTERVESHPNIEIVRQEAKEISASPTVISSGPLTSPALSQSGCYLTANAFQVLGQQPLIGRDFAPGEEKRGAERVVLLGYSIWKNRYGADPSVLGRPLRVNGEPATIIGVMPEGMRFPTNADTWMARQPPEAERRDQRGLQIFGRLKADATHRQAQAEMERIAAAHAAKYPETNKELPTALVLTFNQRFNGGPIQQIFLAMMGAVGFVLLIACANVANLQLSRAANRSREIAVRVALGASRWRVVRQLLVESVVLGCLGGAFGMLLALGGIRAFDAAVADI